MDCGLRTGYKIRTRYKMRTGYKTRIRYKTRTADYGLGIKYGLRTTLVKTVLNFGSTTQYNMNRKTIRFILAVSAEHRRYNNTLYNIFYYIQICGVRTRTELSDSLHRILSEQRPEKTCRKKTSVRKKTRQEIWVGSMAHALKSPPYEGYTAGRTLPLF